MKRKTKTFWRLVAKSLGEKSGKNNQEADLIALIRLFMFLSVFVTNGFIIANAVRHWNDNECDYRQTGTSNASLGHLYLMMYPLTKTYEFHSRRNH